ncbi:MAG TPA: hypothetical protein VI299_15670 [Polyangiales bacterium]
MSSRIRSLALRLPVAVQWTSQDKIEVEAIVAPRSPREASGKSPSFMRVWLDLNQASRGILFIQDTTQDRFLVRVVPHRGGDQELMRESLATVVETAVEAMLAGAQIGLTREDAVREIEAQTGSTVMLEVPTPLPPTVVAPVVTEQPKSGSARPPLPLLEAALAYRGDALAVGPSISHGLELALWWRAFVGRSLDLTWGVLGRYAAPVVMEDRGRAVLQHGGGARAVLGATVATGRFVWRSALGVGLDAARVTPQIEPETGLVQGEPFITKAPVMTLLVSWGIALGPWLSLLLGGGADADLSAHHFDAQGPLGRTRLLSPWQVHPYWFVGASTPLAWRGAR